MPSRPTSRSALRSSPRPTRSCIGCCSLRTPRPDDVVVDLGSGDGRIVIAAAQKFGARGLGIEIDAGLVREIARQRAQGRRRRSSDVPAGRCPRCGHLFGERRDRLPAARPHQPAAARLSSPPESGHADRLACFRDGRLASRRDRNGARVATAPGAGPGEHALSMGRACRSARRMGGGGGHAHPHPPELPGGGAGGTASRPRRSAPRAPACAAATSCGRPTACASRAGCRETALPASSSGPTGVSRSCSRAPARGACRGSSRPLDRAHA